MGGTRAPVEAAGVTVLRSITVELLGCTSKSAANWLGWKLLLEEGIYVLRIAIPGLVGIYAAYSKSNYPGCWIAPYG